MKLDLARMAVNLGRREIVFVPVLLALGIKVASHTSWQPTVTLWGVALVPGVAGLVVFELAIRRRLSRSGRAIMPSEIEKEVELIVYAYGLLVVAEFVFVGAMDWRIGFGLLAIVATWALLGATLQNRRMETRNSVDVVCSPQMAFEFISDPRNWHLFAPEMELRGEVVMPVQVGTVIPCRTRLEIDLVLDVDEVVLELEPGRQFKTGIRGTPKPAAGEYTFEPAGKGTRIDYTYRSCITVAEGVLNGPFSRSKLIKAMTDKRIDILRRIKGLLEDRGAATV
jgi:hypothetical protein